MVICLYLRFGSEQTVPCLFPAAISATSVSCWLSRTLRTSALYWTVRAWNCPPCRRLPASSLYNSCVVRRSSFIYPGVTSTRMTLAVHPFGKLYSGMASHGMRTDTWTLRRSKLRQSARLEFSIEPQSPNPEPSREPQTHLKAGHGRPCVLSPRICPRQAERMQRAHRRAKIAHTDAAQGYRIRKLY